MRSLLAHATGHFGGRRKPPRDSPTSPGVQKCRGCNYYSTPLDVLSRHFCPTMGVPAPRPRKLWQNYWCRRQSETLRRCADMLFYAKMPSLVRLFSAFLFSQAPDRESLGNEEPLSSSAGRTARLDVTRCERLSFIFHKTRTRRKIAPSAPRERIYKNDLLQRIR